MHATALAEPSKRTRVKREIAEVATVGHASPCRHTAKTANKRNDLKTRQPVRKRSGALVFKTTHGGPPANLVNVPVLLRAQREYARARPSRFARVPREHDSLIDAKRFVCVAARQPEIPPPRLKAAHLHSQSPTAPGWTRANSPHFKMRVVNRFDLNGGNTRRSIERRVDEGRRHDQGGHAGGSREA